MIAFSENSGIAIYSKIEKMFMLFLFFGFCTACTENPKQVESNRPEDNRFTLKVLVEGLEEPLQIEFDQSGYVYWIERIGNVKRFNEKTGEVEKLGTVDLTEETVPGLIGILLDRYFETNRQLFLFYSAAADKGNALRLSRFELGKEDKMDMSTEKIIMTVPWEQPDGQHFGG